MAQNIFNNSDIPLGVRVEFFYQWSQWMNTIDPHVQLLSKENENPQSKPSKTQKPVTDKINVPSTSTNNPPINLYDILKSNSYGKSVMQTLKNADGSIIEIPELKDNNRKLLIDSVLQYCITYKHDLTKSDCASLTAQICKVFPGELPVQYHFSFIEFFFTFTLEIFHIH